MPVLALPEVLLAILQRQGSASDLFAQDPRYFDPRTFGATANGIADDTALLQKAVNAAGQQGGVVKIFPGCQYRCTGDITVPVGQGQVVDFEGSGWGPTSAASGNFGSILFDGAGVTHGLNFAGGSGQLAGRVINLHLQGKNGAAAAVTFNGVDHPLIEHSLITGFAGRAVYIFNCIESVLDRAFMYGCGSASQATVEVDSTPGTLTNTTFRWMNSRISGGTGTVGGLLVDRTSVVTMIGGDIESIGPPVRMGSKSESAFLCGVDSITVLGMDFENPGNNPYLDFGAGLSGSAVISELTVQGCVGASSGSIQQDFAVRLANVIGAEFAQNRWYQAGAPVSTHELVGAANAGIVIPPHRGSLGNAWPWVRRNGAQVKAAGPQIAWYSDSVPVGLVSMGTNLSGAGPSILISTTQGGYYGKVGVSNGGATNFSTLTGGERGMEIILWAQDANTTIVHSALGTANGFHNSSGASFATVAGSMYRYDHDGTMWIQN